MSQFSTQQPNEPTQSGHNLAQKIEALQRKSLVYRVWEDPRFNKKLRREQRSSKLRSIYGDDGLLGDEGDEGDENEPGIEDDDEMEKLSQVVQTIIGKNKLNAKNAFEVPLIDVTSLKSMKNNDESSWSKISSVLENSSKVYSFRVDFMADKISKMTSTITRNEQASGDLDIKIPQAKSYVEPTTTYIDCTVDDQPEEDIYAKHLQKQKNLQQDRNERQGCGHFNLNIRRMFDQNGVAGLLLARLPITPRLNIEINASIIYEAAPNTGQALRYQLPQIGLDQLSVFSNLEEFKKHCLNKPQQQLVQILEQCYNLDFDQPPQRFMSEEPQYNYQFDLLLQPNMNKQSQNCQISAILQNTNPILDERGRSNTFMNESFFSSTAFSNYSIIVDPFEPSCAYDRNPKARRVYAKKEQGEQDKNKKRKRNKREQVQVDFKDDFWVIDKLSVLCCSLDNTKTVDNKRPKKIRDKHLNKTVVNDFSIIYETNYKPFTQKFNNRQQFELPRQKLLEISSNINLQSVQEIQNNSLNSFLPDFSNYSDPRQSQIFINKMPSIKSTKNKIWSQIKYEPETYFSNLVKAFANSNEYVCQQIILVSLLHLCNQKNLILSEVGPSELKIVNTSPEQKKMVVLE